MRIELTEEQRRTVEQEAGRPVEVVDPGTERSYMLIPREAYEKVRDVLEGGSEKAEPPSSAPASEFPEEANPQRVLLNNLPAPPELVAEAERRRKKLGFWGKKARQELLEECKLQYYFGGQPIYTLQTAEGLLVIPIPERYRNTPGRKDILLTPAERPKACFDVPSPLDDTRSQLLL
jgi:hypothetical protein